MSISALLNGVETALRAEAVFNDRPGESVGALVGVQPDGSPPANFGQTYIAVHFLGLTNADPNSLSDDWFFSVGVTVTARLNYSPRDRQGKRITFADALLDRAHAVALALHQNDTHRIEANKLIVGTAEYVAIHGGSATVNGFLEPLRLASIGEVRKAPPGWGGIESTNDVFTVALRFVEARRVQLLGSFA